MVSSILQSRAAKKAASAQGTAESQAAQMNLDMFKQIRSDLAPYRETGGRALGALEDLFIPGEDGDAPDYSEFFKSPGYQFRFDEGLRGLDRSAAARGRLQSGGYGRELTRYGQGVASEEFNNYANRLAGLAGMGQNAAAQTGQLGLAATGAAGQHIANAGTARASGYVGQANALAAFQGRHEVNPSFIAGMFGGSGGSGGGSALGSAIGAAAAASSREIKENGEPVDAAAILDAVRALPVEFWNYIGDDRRRIGPYAEDFKDMFGVGDGETLDYLDTLGVLFAAVKALAERDAERERAQGAE